MFRLARTFAPLAILLTLAQSAVCCPGLRLPRIDPTGQRFFLPAPNYTTVSPFGTRPPLWQSPPPPPLCGTPESGAGVVPYSIFGAPPPNVPTTPAVAPPPVGSPSNLQLTGSTSDDRRDGLGGRLVVNPTRLVALVGQEVLIRAAICGDDGYLIMREPLEWTLAADSVGSIVEVDQTNKSIWRQLFQRPPYKRDGGSAMGLTSGASQVVPRGIPGPADDLFLDRGETWISVSSPSEGATHVICVAPTVAGWEQRRGTATIHWIDGQWQFPSPTIANPQTGQRLCTQIVRTTSLSPIAGWQVNYEVIGGMPATFDNGQTAISVTSDAAGQACATLTPQTTESGSTQVRMVVTRTGLGPADPASINLGEGTTNVTWTTDGSVSPPVLPPNAPPTLPPTLPPRAGTTFPPALPPTLPPREPSSLPPTLPPSSPPLLPPGASANDGAPPGAALPPAGATDFSIRLSGPAAAQVDETVPFTISVRNTGSTVAPGVEVVNPVPPGMRYVDSSPPANVFGDRLVWRLGSVEGGDNREIQVRYQIDQGGSLRNCAAVTWGGGRLVDECQTINVAVNPLRVDVQGPRSAPVGQSITYQIVVSNLSGERLDNVLVEDRHDSGLAHPGMPGISLKQNIGSLAAGQSRTVPLTFKVLGAGQLCQDITVTADGGLSTRTQICLDAGQSSLGAPISGGQAAFQVQKIGPPQVAVGQQANITIQVTNTGQIDLTDLRVVDQYDPRLEPLAADPPVQRQDDTTIFWEFPVVRPGQTLRMYVRCVAREGNGQVCDTVRVTTAQGITESDELCLAIVPNAFGGLPLPREADRELAADLPSVSTVGLANDFRLAAKPNIGQGPFDVTVVPVGISDTEDDTSTYYLSLTNVSDEQQEKVVLTVETPAGSTFAKSLNPPMVRPVRISSDKRTVEFLPIATLRPQETARFRLVVQRNQATIGTFRAKVASESSPDGTVFTP